MKINFNGYFYKNEKQKAIEASSIFGKHFKISEKFYFTVHSVTKNKSQSLNKDYFKKNKPTDVLSFPSFHRAIPATNDAFHSFSQSCSSRHWHN